MEWANGFRNRTRQRLIHLENKVTTAATLDQDSLHTKLQNNLTVEIDAKLVQPLADLQELFYMRMVPGWCSFDLRIRNYIRPKVTEN